MPPAPIAEHGRRHTARRPAGRGCRRAIPVNYWIKSEIQIGGWLGSSAPSGAVRSELPREIYTVPVFAAPREFVCRGDLLRRCCAGAKAERRCRSGPGFVRQIYVLSENTVQGVAVGCTAPNALVAVESGALGLPP